MKRFYLSDYMGELLSRGELILSKEEAMNALQVSNAAFLNSIKRQVASGKLISLFQGYYLIIPVEYSKLGFVPPELFIDDLMKYIQVPYYVSLLSAAGFYGASHQAVQVFQVMVPKNLKTIVLNGTKIKFYYNTKFQNTLHTKIKTDRGYLNVSSPESTALDLIKYVHQSGNLNRIVTVLNELAEVLKSSKLKIAGKNYPPVYVQRLGYILDTLGYENLTRGLATLVQLNTKKIYHSLRPDKEVGNSEKDQKWFLYINERIEPDI